MEDNFTESNTDNSKLVIDNKYDDYELEEADFTITQTGYRVFLAFMISSLFIPPVLFTLFFYVGTKNLPGSFALALVMLPFYFIYYAGFVLSATGKMRASLDYKRYAAEIGGKVTPRQLMIRFNAKRDDVYNALFTVREMSFVIGTLRPSRINGTFERLFLSETAIERKKAFAAKHGIPLLITDKADAASGIQGDSVGIHGSLGGEGVEGVTAGGVAATNGATGAGAGGDAVLVNGNNSGIDGVQSGVTDSLVANDLGGAGAGTGGNDTSGTGGDAFGEDGAKYLPPEIREMVNEGNAYISKFQDIKDEISDNEMKGKISEIEETLSDIFDRIEDEPQLSSNLKKLIRYYLPTTNKLLAAYAELDKSIDESETVIKTKADIMRGINMLNDGYDKFLDSLYTDMAWEIAGDIDILEQMIKQDGLGEDDFDIN